MSKSDVVQRLLEELNNQNQIYIAIIALILGFLGVMQWRFSDQQIKKMKDDFKKDFKIEEINRSLDRAQSIEEEMLEQLRQTEEFNLKMQLYLLEHLTSTIDSTDGVDNIVFVKQNLEHMINHGGLEQQTFKKTMNAINRMLTIINNNSLKGNNEFNSALSNLMSLVLNYYEVNKSAWSVQPEKGLEELYQSIKKEYKNYTSTLL